MKCAKTEGFLLKMPELLLLLQPLLRKSRAHVTAATHQLQEDPVQNPPAPPAQQSRLPAPRGVMKNIPG